jgi:uncharacterized SAM-binding protein YcdF (DUF218 family)
MLGKDPARIDIGGDGAAMLAISVLVAVGTGGLSLLATAGFVLWHAVRARARVAPGHGPIVVLGHRPDRGNQVSAAFRARLDRSRVLAARSPAPIIVLGGATRPGMPTEAEIGAAYLVSHGVPSERILTEQGSRHTLENLRELRRTLAGLGPVGQPVLVTSRVHLARAGQMAAFMGLALAPCAAEDRYRPSLSILLEAGLTHWYLTGRIVTQWTGSRHLARRIG